MATSRDTRRKLETGLALLEAMIRQAPKDMNTQMHRYDGRISIKEVLRLGGIKSQATVHGKHHRANREWLAKRVEELKVLGGKRKADRQIVESSLSLKEQNELLIQRLAAAHYELLRLRGQKKSSGNVLPFKKPR